MGLIARGDDMPVMHLVIEAAHGADGVGEVTTKVVHGNRMNLMATERLSTGYHSKPHVHIAEQINFLVSGASDFYVRDKCFRMHAGDFVRIPSDAFHWSQSTGEALIVEVHSPGFHRDPLVNAVPLYAANETPAPEGHARNLYLDLDTYDFDLSVAEAAAPTDHGLYAAGSSVTQIITSTGGTLSSVHGVTVGMTVRSEPAGARSPLEASEAEQLYWFAEGTVSFTVDNDTFLLGPGDFLRIPELSIVQWNVSEDARWVQVYAPNLVGDPVIAARSLGLFAPDETIPEPGSARQFVLTPNMIKR